MHWIYCLFKWQKIYYFCFHILWHTGQVVKKQKKLIQVFHITVLSHLHLDSAVCQSQWKSKLNRKKKHDVSWKFSLLKHSVIKEKKKLNVFFFLVILCWSKNKVQQSTLSKLNDIKQQKRLEQPVDWILEEHKINLKKNILFEFFHKFD